MDKFERVLGVALPLLRANIDTDAIIPSREMKRVSKLGLGEALFAGWRYLGSAGREPDPEFVLNRPAYRDASILLAGANFGCGSSREHAVWALQEFGIRAVIAPGFGAIFANNCVRNGLLPLVLDEAAIADIARWVEVDPAAHRVLIDLPGQRVEAGSRCWPFEIDRAASNMLVQGLDAIALTQTRSDLIGDFHQQRRQLRPWLF